MSCRCIEKKRTRVLGEVLVGDESLADRGHLELELDQRRSSSSHQHVVGPPPLDHRDLEAFVGSPCWMPAFAAAAAILL